MTLETIAQPLDALLDMVAVEQHQELLSAHPQRHRVLVRAQHRRDRAQHRIADRVAVLQDGAIHDVGTHAELLRRNTAYARLVNAYEADGDAGASGGTAGELPVDRAPGLEQEVRP